MLTRLALAVAVGSWNSILAAQSPALSGDARNQELVAFLDEVVPREMARAGVPGATVAVVSGETNVIRGYGYANIERQTRVDPDRSIFRIGSITKLFTSTAVIQLSDRGLLDVHADVNRYLVRLRVPDSYSRPVTSAHLLTHTAGFDERNRGRRASGPGAVLPLPRFLSDRLVRIRPPGEISSYGTYGLTLAAVLVEDISRIGYQDYVADRIFRPLGMTRSSIGTVPEPMRADLALGYVRQGNRFRAAQFEYFHSFPASDINSTASDMARFLRAHLHGGSDGNARILSQAASDEMHKRQFTHHPRLAGWTYGFRELFQNGERAIWHGGSMEGFGALLFLVPARDFGLFIAYNRETAELAEHVKNALMNRYFPYEAAADPRPAGADTMLRDLSRFAGAYRSTEYCHQCSDVVETIAARRLAPRFRIGINTDGTLSLWGERLIQVEPLLFRVAGDRGYIAFREGERGRITHLFAAQSSYERLD